MKEQSRVIIIGPNPVGGKGGIASAISGYVQALETAQLQTSFIASHENASILRKLWLLARLPLALARSINTTKRRNRHVILYIHIGPWLSMLRKLFIVLLGRFFGTNIACQVHSFALDSYLNSIFGRAACRWYFRRMDRVLVLSKWWQQRLQSAGIQNVEVVPNPLGGAFENAANSEISESETHSNQGTIRILSMTRLIPGKGVDLVIQALSHLPLNYHLTIAGTGTEKSKLERLAHFNGVNDRVDFLGWVSGDDRLSLLKEHDIFALPSQNDSFGMGFIEAMAFGLPVVALNSGPIADVVPNNIGGFLIDHPDSKLLAEAIKKLESPTLRAEMGRGAQHWVREQYSLQTVGLKLKEIVLSLNS